MNAPDITIQVVTDDEAGELLTLRRAAFVTEAQIYGDPNIPPLTQTLGELRADLALKDVVTLGARYGHRLVGSIRVVFEDKKATLGRLAVAPDLQGKGIGTKLLLAILPHLPEDTEEVWVFTGQDSVQNIAMYAKNGYEHQYDRTAGDLTYAYLRRILGDDGEDDGEFDGEFDGEDSGDPDDGEDDGDPDGGDSQSSRPDDGGAAAPGAPTGGRHTA